MKILHVVPTYLPATRYGGPIYSVHGLCRALAAMGHEVHVFTTNVDGDTDSDVPLGKPVPMDGVNVWYFASRAGRRLYWSPDLCRALKHSIRDFDVVHLHSVFLWPTWAAARMARRCGVPYVLSPRGMLVEDLVKRKSRLLKTAWIKLIETRNIERAAAVHVTARVEREEFERFGFRQPCVWAIPNGVEAPSGYREEDLTPDVKAATGDPPYALFLGRLNWKKGLDRLIKAIPGVDRGRFVIAGNDEEGYLADVERMIREQGVEERVTLIPRFVVGADKEALYAGAALFVLPSYSENFGNTVTEALARGCPAVVTEDVGAAEVVRAAQGGYVVDTLSLASTMNLLMTDRNLARHLGAQGRRWIEAHLSWAAVAVSMAAKYRQLADPGCEKDAA
ncbi:MAG: glycosyltransferase [Sulfitobacter sp.]|nr:glycosyltransferase [Sulfitobacter sp.]